ncbi:MAG: ribose 5-phosphate isomerase B [Planctomycetes bacterium RBG_16_59_8]|nr:MAG: ribose 5-phosphate isomerase B [Planctomycetes bacterium RBG_16_59_8]
MKESIKTLLVDLGHEVLDCGTMSGESVDYPDFAVAVAAAVAGKKCDRGVLCCGTGIGMAMTANKTQGIRAAVCQDEYTAEFSRRHNDANVLCLGARVLSLDRARKLTRIWMDAKFDAGRHQARVNKIG